MIRHHLPGLLIYYEALKPLERLQGLIDEVGDPFSGLTNPDPDHQSSPDLAACLRGWKFFATSERKVQPASTLLSHCCSHFLKPHRRACSLRSRRLSTNHIYL